MMVRKSKGLGERHQRILDFLLEYQRENRYPPSIREIGNKTGITSTSVVNYYLDQLEKKGMIERDRKIPEVARDLGIGSPETLRNWVKQARRDAGLEVGPTTEELAEIRRLRKEVADQQRTIEILKAATTYFALEADPRSR